MELQRLRQVLHGFGGQRMILTELADVDVERLAVERFGPIVIAFSEQDQPQIVEAGCHHDCGIAEDGAADLEGFAARVGGLQLLVTGRFHALILAFATGTPVLALGSNTHKIEATLRDAGLEDFRMSAPEQIDAALIERASRWQGDEAARLAAYVEDGRGRMQALFRRMRALAR